MTRAGPRSTTRAKRLARLVDLAVVEGGARRARSGSRPGPGSIVDAGRRAESRGLLEERRGPRRGRRARAPARPRGAAAAGSASGGGIVARNASTSARLFSASAFFPRRVRQSGPARVPLGHELRLRDLLVRARRSTSARASRSRPRSASIRARKRRAPTRSSACAPVLAPSVGEAGAPRRRRPGRGWRRPAPRRPASARAGRRRPAAAGRPPRPRPLVRAARGPRSGPSRSSSTSSGSSAAARSKAARASSVRPWVELEVAPGSRSPAARSGCSAAYSASASRARSGWPGRHVGLGQAHVAARGRSCPRRRSSSRWHEGLGVAPQLEQQLGEVVAGRGVVGRRVDRLLVGGDRLVDGRRVERVVAALDVVALAGREVARRVRQRLRRVLARLRRCRRGCRGRPTAWRAPSRSRGRPRPPSRR